MGGNFANFDSCYNFNNTIPFHDLRQVFRLLVLCQKAYNVKYNMGIKEDALREFSFTNDLPFANPYRL